MICTSCQVSPKGLLFLSASKDSALSKASVKAKRSLSSARTSHAAAPANAMGVLYNQSRCHPGALSVTFLYDSPGPWFSVWTGLLSLFLLPRTSLRSRFHMDFVSPPLFLSADWSEGPGDRRRGRLSGARKVCCAFRWQLRSCQSRTARCCKAIFCRIRTATTACRP